MGRLFKEMLVIALAVVAVVYLMYPSLGIFELIPDGIPLIGSLDEASATLLLIGALRYYGFDVSKLYGKRDQAKQLPQRTPARTPARTPSRPQSLPE
jgi:hypothetical protein